MLYVALSCKVTAYLGSNRVCGDTCYSGSELQSHRLPGFNRVCGDTCYSGSELHSHLPGLNRVCGDTCYVWL